MFFTPHQIEEITYVISNFKQSIGDDPTYEGEPSLRDLQDLQEKIDTEFEGSKFTGTELIWLRDQFEYLLDQAQPKTENMSAYDEARLTAYRVSMQRGIVKCTDAYNNK